MTLRRKFLLTLVGLVVFLALIFGVIALTSMQALSEHAARYIEQSFTQQWNRSLTSYYEQKGSWQDLQAYVSKVLNEAPLRFAFGQRDEPLLVFDDQDVVVASSRTRDLGKGLEDFAQASIKDQWHEITVNGRIVGHFWVDQRLFARQGRLARDLAQSLVPAMVIGLVATALLAALFGALLARRFTVPLRQLAEGVRQVAKGDLTPRLAIKGKDEIAVLASAFNSMAEQLARNEEVRRNMVADIAHELRTPLAIILGKLESIQEGVLPSTPESLLPIQDETIRLIRLVRDLQQLSLAEAGKLALAIRDVELKRLLERIVEQFEFELADRHIQCAVCGDDIRLQADPDRLTQVFVNIIGNAILHTPAGGQICVRMEQVMGEGAPAAAEEARWSRLNRIFPGGGKPEPDLAQSSGTPVAWPPAWARIAVEDTGEGIPEDELVHVFDRFYRVDKARDRETGGTGLGLAIAKEFVEAHRGKIEVASALGRGTRFTVWLPVLSGKSQ